jgi:cytochrome P450
MHDRVDDSPSGTRTEAKRAAVVRMSMIGQGLNEFVTKVTQAFETAGDVIQIKAEAPVLIFCFRHPKHIRDIYSHKATSLTKPGGFFQMQRANRLMGNGLFNDLGGAEWKRKRNFVNPHFERAPSLAYDKLVIEVVQDLMHRWEKNADQGRPIDLFYEMRAMAADFCVRSLFDVRLGHQLDAFVEDSIFVEGQFVSQIPYWAPTLRNLRNERAQKRMRRLFDGWVADSRRTGKQGAVAQQLFGPTDDAIGRQWTHDEVRDECFSVYFGGLAVSNPITWTLVMLSRHPIVLRKLQDELARVLGDRLPTAADLPQLPYLEMVFKESMRLYPTFWGSLRYSEDPIEIDGYRFPSKSTFMPVRYSAQRHPDFWDNPEGFDPERFAPGNKSKSEAIALLPYGGSSPCPCRLQPGDRDGLAEVRATPQATTPECSPRCVRVRNRSS